MLNCKDDSGIKRDGHSPYKNPENTAIILGYFLTKRNEICLLKLKKKEST